MKKAVVLLSGGLDSTTTLYLAKARGFRCFCLIFNYGQRHKKEVSLAKTIAEKNLCRGIVLDIKLPWGGSALLDKDIPLPQNRKCPDIPKEIPPTYVPGRNTLFLSYALSFAESIGARDIFIGANAIDFSGYPDCRPAFFTAFNRLSTVATKAGVSNKRIKVHAPLLYKTKAGIIKLGMKLKVPFALTWSCYRGGKRPCGQCDSCILRQEGFRVAGTKDPLYVN